MYLFFIGIIILFIGIILISKASKQNKQTIDEIILKNKNEIEKQINAEKQDLINVQNSISSAKNQLSSIKSEYKINLAKNQAEKDKYEVVKKSTQDMIEAEKRSGQTQIAAEREKARLELSNVRQLEEEKIRSDMAQLKTQLLQAYAAAALMEEENFEEQEETFLADIEIIKKELAEFQAKRAAINEQLRREEELANEVDFHRIILTQNSKEDIHYLLSIEDNIHNKELLHKLIWTEYIQKPFNQMLKNILGNKSPKNIIYCIENINTHKKYIGKTAGEVSKRWTEHIKSSLSIGTISHQVVHDALNGHWDEFTFSILEEVEDGKLNDREKYYISFFETDKYGYNMKKGG